MKKVNKNYQGQCLLKQLPQGTIFKIIKKDGTLTKATYIIDEFDGYDRTNKKYSYSNYWNLNDCHEKNGNTKVSTDFIF